MQVHRHLRILMVSAHYPPMLNGYAIQCADTSNLLAERGHSVRVVTGETQLLPPLGAAVRLPVLRHASPEGRAGISAAAMMRLFGRWRTYRHNVRQCVAAVRDQRPDVALVWQFDSVGIGVAIALQRQGVPVAFNVEDVSLATVVGLLGKSSIAGSLRRWLYDVDPDELDLSRLMLVSSDLRAQYALKGFPGTAMTVVHNGLPASQIAAEPPTAGLGTRLLFVGRLHSTKGVSLAIEALALANQRRTTKLTLDLIGTGESDYVASLTSLVEARGMAPFVRFLGHRDRDAIFALYADYDMLLFPSTWREPFGLTTIEAMARGVPVIALDRGGPREIISDRIDGLLVDDTPVAYAGAIDELANSPELRLELGRAAILKVASQFTVERQATQTEALLRAIVDQQWRAGERKAS